MRAFRCTYPHGKEKCLTLSYDDARTQDRRLVEMLNQYGIKATFHLFSNSFGRGDDRFIAESEIVSLYEGHEIACHLASHPWVDQQPLSQLVNEGMEDRKFLERYTSAPIRGLSYPYGRAGKEQQDVLRSIGFCYGRTNVSSETLYHPQNFMQWDPTCHHNSPDLMRLCREFLAPTSWIAMRLFAVWGHSYEFDTHNNWDRMEQFCQAVSGQDDVWYATNIEVYDYLTAVKSLVMGANNDRVYNPSAITVYAKAGDKVLEIRPGETVIL